MKTGKRLEIMLGLMLAALIFCACESTAENNAAADTAAAVQTEHVKVKVDGMTCEGCAATIEAALAENQGVTQKSVNLKEGCCEVEYNPAQTSREEIVGTIEKAGYKASVAE